MAVFHGTDVRGRNIAVSMPVKVLALHPHTNSRSKNIQALKPKRGLCLGNDPAPYLEFPPGLFVEQPKALRTRDFAPQKKPPS